MPAKFSSVWHWAQLASMYSLPLSLAAKSLRQLAWVDVAEQRLRPELVLAVAVVGFEAAALAVVADGAAEVGELVAPLPVAVALARRPWPPSRDGS